jgi:glycine/D-amino acid oxidase-like deaminating enzyme
LNYDVLIIGAGIVGAACAARLTMFRQCAIVDEFGPAAGATAAAMGHIVAMDDSDAQFALTAYSRGLWKKLVSELKAEAEYDPCGTIWVAADDEEMAEVVRKHEFLAQRGLAAEILDEKSLLDAEPHLRHGLAGGLLVPDDGVVYQPAVVDHLLYEAAAAGCDLIRGRRAVKISGGDVNFADGSKISAKIIVNCAGIGAVQLTPGVEIVPRKGHLVITDRYPNFLSHQLIELGYLKSAHGSTEDSVAFNAQPRSTGQILLGSSRQLGVTDSGVDCELLRRMTERGFEYMPGLRNLSALRVWTGFRPATPDDLPYIGRVPGPDNVFVAAGHEGLGITTSLGTAELICDAILGRESQIPREPYRVGRAMKTEH